MKLRQCLCRGTVRLVAGLESLGMMGQKAGEWPEFRFTSPEIVHRERFMAFQNLDVSQSSQPRLFLLFFLLSCLPCQRRKCKCFTELDLKPIGSSSSSSEKLSTTGVLGVSVSVCV